jgi:peptidoglycan-N-acetylglucosamine deacetylase
MPATREIVSWLTLGRASVRVAARPRTVFLTFDDGPHPEHTPRLLATLRRFGARATFFMIGRVLREHPEVATEVHRAGHRLANHSTHHPWFNRISWARQRQEIAETDSLLQAVDGQATHLFRPPHGRMSGACVARTLLGPLRVSLWTTDSLDYRLTSAEVVAHLRTSGVQGGDILLFHDDAAVAADALETLLPEWRAQGLDFAALPD